MTDALLTPTVTILHARTGAVIGTAECPAMPLATEGAIVESSIVLFSSFGGSCLGLRPDATTAWVRRAERAIGHCEIMVTADAILRLRGALHQPGPALESIGLSGGDTIQEVVLHDVSRAASRGRYPALSGGCLVVHGANTTPGTIGPELLLVHDTP